MTRRLTLLALALVAGPAAAQVAPDPRPSHVPVPRAEGTDPARLFAEKIQQSKLRADLDGLLKQFRGDPARASDFLRQFQEMLRNNPGLRDQLRELTNDDGRLAGLLDSVRQSNPEVGGLLTPDVVRKQLRNLGGPPDGPAAVAPPKVRPSSPAGEPDRPAERRPRTPPPQKQAERPRTPPPPADPAEREAREAWARQLERWASRFDPDRLTGPLRNSPALQNLLRDLARSGGEALRRGASGEGLDAQLARWQRRWETARDWLPDVRLPDGFRPNLDGVQLPELLQSNIRLPNLDLTPPALPSGGVGVAAANAADLFQGLLLVAAAVVLGMVLWRWQGVRAAKAALARRHLGPWPTDPARVGTREELIRAFEYLSLLRLGEPARSWHHRAIADRLGDGDADRRVAADRLAALYEQARYAPDAARLTEPAFADARRHLTHLAGAAGA
jgi:hypothetical protein